MKIFEIRFTEEKEKAWVYAKTNIDAINTYCCVTSTGLYDFDDTDEVVELPKEKWSEFTVYDEESEAEDSNKMTFEQWVEENKDSGSDVIAVTLQ